MLFQLISAKRIFFFPFRLAAKYNMKLLWKKNFHDLFKENERSYSTLLTKMNALEVRPPNEYLYFISSQYFPVFDCFFNIQQQLLQNAGKHSIKGIIHLVRFQSFPKNSRFLRIRNWAFQGVESVSFSDSLANVLYE